LAGFNIVLCTIAALREISLAKRFA
jgi:hypothetical protein